MFFSQGQRTWDIHAEAAVHFSGEGAVCPSAHLPHRAVRRVLPGAPAQSGAHDWYVPWCAQTALVIPPVGLGSVSWLQYTQLAFLCIVRLKYNVAFQIIHYNVLPLMAGFEQLILVRGSGH